MRYEFHPAALEEYREAALWYSDRDQNVALRFVACIEDAILRVVESPQRWRVIDEDIRRCLTHVFPYAILYTIEDDFILVVAVMHVSREPGYWNERIEKRT
jgi:plasmid stabilization system protein ParE